MASHFDTNKIVTYCSAVFLFALSLFFAFNQQFHHKIETHFQPSERKILSTINSAFDSSGIIYDVLKVRENNLISIEIFKLRTNQSPEMIQKIELPHARDGYFIYQFSSTNLAVRDVDHDNVPEILAPTFDSNFSARLNVVKYNAETRNFYLVLEPITPFY